MTASVTITFTDPDGSGTSRTKQASPGDTFISVGQAAGLDITATCGERGRCRSCRIKILKGEVPPPTIMDQVQLGHEEVQERFRLSCQTKIIGDATVMIAPPKAEVGHQILAAGRHDARIHQVGLDSGIEKHFIQAKIPDDEDNQSSDIEEVLAALGVDVTGEVPGDVYRKLPAALRDRNGKLTVTTFNNRIIDVEAGDSTDQKYGMAFDIGTTSIVGSLLDLDSGQELASVGGMNPQAVYGGDLMSRIAYAMYDAKKLQTLRAKVLNAVNGFIKEACAAAEVEPAHVHKVVIVGNTCMHHIFFGIDPTYVGLAPYAPSVRDPIVVSGKEVLLKTIPNAQVCFLPIIAGFVGADTMACVLATRIYESEEIRALVDIGTNGEVVMGRKGRLMACSAPAGPALEGAQIRHGMRGAMGAIEKVEIGDDIACRVIGDVPPIGICGSGLIDAVAKMLDAGLLDQSGLIRYEARASFPAPLRDRLTHKDDRDQFVLSWADDSGKDEDIVLTQSDVRQLQLAKGAICSGVMVLQHVMNIADDDITELMLCGAFGNYISTESAVRMRLLPALPLDRITYSGNAAAMGAQIALLSETERHRAATLARQIEHVSLAAHPEFQDIFVVALQFPAEPESAPGGIAVRSAKAVEPANAAT